MVAPASRSLPERIARAAEALCERLGFAPQLAGVLGAGHQGLLDHLQGARVLDATQVDPEFAFAHGVPLCAGELFGIKTVLTGPILPAWAGHSAMAATLPLRVLRTAGVQVVVLTAGAASIDPALPPGSVAVLHDHLDADRQNPLAGEHLAGNDDAALGPRFLDQEEPYAPRLRTLFARAARDLDTKCAEVTFAGIRGPALPTRAERRLLRAAGAQAMGMSLVPEAIVARHAGCDVLAAIAITQHLPPDAPAPTAIADLLAAADLAVPRLERLLAGFARRLAQAGAAPHV